MGLKNKFFAPIYLLVICSIVKADFDLSNSIYNFSVATFQTVNKNNANFIMSPISAQMVLALTYEGASGPTAAAMNAGLDLIGQTQQQVASDFHGLISSLLEVDGNTALNIANKIYLNDSFQVSPAFKADADEFDSAVEMIHFANNVNAAKEINAWASQETDGNIQDVVTASDFSAATAAVLINAIYFKGMWQHQFHPSQTQKSTFYTSLTTIQQIEMMNMQDSFNFGHIPELNASALQMQYLDPSLSMLFLLPKAIDGLPDLVFNGLGKVNIQSILNNMYSRQVIVKIPKYTIKVNIPLKDVLSQLGMGIMFDSQNANFSNMVTKVPQGDNLFISSVQQKAFIEVNEGGAKAAAVTVVEMPASPGKPGVPSLFTQISSFIADHPFVMMILKDNNVLFIGCFVQGDGAVSNFTGVPNISSSSSLSTSSLLY